jgi:hypothetical protein
MPNGIEISMRYVKGFIFGALGTLLGLALLAVFFLIESYVKDERARGWLFITWTAVVGGIVGALFEAKGA